jgi:thymidylate synthase
MWKSVQTGRGRGKDRIRTLDGIRSEKFYTHLTKRVFVRGVIEELLWFVSGSSDATVLGHKNVKIWEHIRASVLGRYWAERSRR